MGWNQSDGRPVNSGTKKRTAGPIVCVIVGAVVCISLGVYFFLRSEAVSTDSNDTVRPTKIADFKAAKARQPAEDGTATQKPAPLGPQKVGETRDGKILLPSGRLHTVKGVRTNDFTKATTGKYAIFNHDCENEIACMLTIEPGEGLVGTPSYNGRFKEEFLESLKEPIIIKADDSEEDKELKRNVIQAKIDLKDAMDRGEDIEQIMLDTRAEYQKLSIYKQELKWQIDELSKEEDCSTQDLEDLVEAANKLLAEKGIAPLKYGPLIKRKILMMKH